MKKVTTLKVQQQSQIAYDFITKEYEVLSHLLGVGKTFTSYNDAEKYFGNMLVAEQFGEQFKPIYTSHRIDNNWVIVKYSKQIFNNDLNIVISIGYLASSVANFTVINQEEIEQSLSGECHNWLDVEENASLLELKDVVHVDNDKFELSEVLSQLFGLGRLRTDPDNPNCWLADSGDIWWFTFDEVVPKGADEESCLITPNMVKQCHKLVCGIEGQNKISAISKVILDNKNTSIINVLKETCRASDLHAMKMVLGDQITLIPSDDSESVIIIVHNDLDFMGTKFTKDQCIRLEIH